MTKQSINKMKSQPTKWEKNESHIFIWGHEIKIHLKNLKKCHEKPNNSMYRWVKEIDFFPKRSTDGQYMYENVLNMTKHQYKANQNHNNNILMILSYNC